MSSRKISLDSVQNQSLVLLAKVVLLALSICSVLLLVLAESLEKKDAILLAGCVLLSLVVFFFLSRAGIPVPVLVANPPEKKEEEPVSSKEQMYVVEETPKIVSAPSSLPKNPQAEPARPQVADASVSENSVVDQLHSIREHYSEPFKNELASLEPEQMTGEFAQKVRSDLYRIAFLYMDYTDFVTRPSTPEKEERIKQLLSGHLSDLMDAAKVVNSHPRETPKLFRNLKAALTSSDDASDEEQFYFSGFKF